MIEFDHVTKAYDGKVVVDDVTFAVRTGRVTGLLGPNGAGKSTLMRMALGLHQPTSGTVRVDGHHFATEPAPLTAVGAMLDAHAVHPGRTGKNQLEWIAATHRLPARRVDEVLALAGLSDVAGRRVGTYSLGMAQRLGIAAALLGQPHTLVLDEPVNGLDPDGVLWVRDLVRSLAASGTTVLISSHLMSEMAQTADDVVVLGRGRLIATGTMEEIVSQASGAQVRVRTVTAPDPLILAIENEGGTVTSNTDGFVTGGLASERIGALAAATGVILAELVPQHASLEDAFFQLTRDAVEYRTETEAS